MAHIFIPKSHGIYKWHRIHIRAWGIRAWGLKTPDQRHLPRVSWPKYPLEHDHEVAKRNLTVIYILTHPHRADEDS